MIKGVLFDMDGLLLDTERLIVTAFQRTSDELNLPDLTEVIHNMIGLRADMGDKLLRTTLDGLVEHTVFDTLWQDHISALFDRGIPLRPGARTVQIPDIKPPSANTRAMGHLIAPSLLEGAREIGLLV
ncbi:MAG: HAD hydrolase-like protein [Paracoccaceae bacterium]